MCEGRRGVCACKASSGERGEVVVDCVCAVCRVWLCCVDVLLLLLCATSERRGEEKGIDSATVSDRRAEESRRERERESTVRQCIRHSTTFRMHSYAHVCSVCNEMCTDR